MIKKILAQKLLLIILTIIIAGSIQKIYVTFGGNFIFNMDNARDFVDVREMVELKKPRLIGPTSAIEGFYNGPGWYLLLAIPYILTQGNPYGAILLMVFLWAIGGFFLMKMVSRFGILVTLAVGFLWTGSDYINLATVYSFNPNPVTFLTPLFIYLLLKYLDGKKPVYLGLTSALGGAFFNFEMNFGIFVLPIIFAVLLLSKNWRLLKTQGLWLALIPFGFALLPQLIFDMRHNFIMIQSIFKFLGERSSGGSLNIIQRSREVYQDFYYVSLPVFLNNLFLLKIAAVIISILIVFLILKKAKSIDSLFIIGLITFLLPFISYIFLPVEVNGWHLGAEMVGLIILFAFALDLLRNYSLAGKFFSFMISFFAIFVSASNVFAFIASKNIPNNDPSLYKNEITAIDYVYQKSEGKNFKAYIYLPSIIDYPYQYLFWWHGLKKYGYTPKDYAYLPNKPAYISNKESFVKPLENGEDSGLVFLIKEPDRINIRHLWENSFARLEKVEYIKLPGIEIETLRDGEIINF